MMSGMMTADQLRDWVARAMPGEDVAYATGERPDRSIAPFAAQLREAGLVALTAKRVGREFRFIAQRRAGSIERLAPVRRFNRGQYRERGQRTSETMILRALNRAADRGLPCPTNAELARVAGLSGAIAASYRMRRLVAAGKIRVEEPSPLERRVVTIVATGKTTVRGAL